jgi:hypothetical protein
MKNSMRRLKLGILAIKKMGSIASNPVEEEFNVETQALDTCSQRNGLLVSNLIEFMNRK